MIQFNQFTKESKEIDDVFKVKYLIIKVSYLDTFEIGRLRD